MIRTVQAPVPSVPPEPSWLGNAQAGLIDAAILGLLPVAIAYRRRWYGVLAGMVWLASVAVLVYYSVRGQGLTFVPAVMMGVVPAWKPLLIGLLAGAVPIGIACSVLAMKNRRLTWQLAAEAIAAQPAPPAPAPLPVPAIAEPAQPTPAQAWDALNDDERALLTMLWHQPEGIIEGHDAEETSERLGHARWNALMFSLQRKGLVSRAYDGQLELRTAARQILVAINPPAPE